MDLFDTSSDSFMYQHILGLSGFKVGRKWRRKGEQDEGKEKCGEMERSGFLVFLSTSFHSVTPSLRHRRATLPQINVS